MTVGPSWPGFIEPKTLVDTGTHTIFVDMWNAGTGAISFRPYTVPADTTTSVTINGSAASVSLMTPGQNGFVTFSGTANQQATVRVTSNSISTGQVVLLKPDGSYLTSVYIGGASFNLTQVTLPVTGTYSISVNPAGAATGSMNVAVTSP